MNPLPKLAPRSPDSHKGDYGRALLIGGSPGMAGAIALAGMAALRSGAGLVKVAVPAAIQSIVAGFEPAYMTVGLPCNPTGRLALPALRELAPFLAEASCVAIGCGLGRSAVASRIVGRLYTNLSQPLIVDADGLNALAVQPELLALPAGPRVLTPHPGEFARLLGRDNVPLAERETVARDLASRAGVVILLKGHRTIVTDGQNVAHNATGNAGMATGGTGDVLTGVITALIGQGLSPFDAARLGAHVHGLAGDLAAADLGQVSLIASDLLRYLPPAFQKSA